MRNVLCLVCALCCLPAPAFAIVQWTELPLEDGGALRYALVLPDDYDESRAWPVLLALPPGGQDERMVQAGLDRYWGDLAAQRGWIVVSPVAVDGRSYFQGSEQYIPVLLEHLRGQFQVEGDGFHLAGASNGGRSAFRIALGQPDDFLSLIVVPGYPPTDEDKQRLHRLVDLPVHLAVGGTDLEWVRVMTETQTRLQELGTDVYLEIFDGEGHVPASLDGGAFMDRLETLRGSVRSNDDTAVAAVLDEFHAAAAAAEGERYFGLFAEDAVFLGTDPGERWTLEEFRGYAQPHFDNGTGWTYTAASRHVFLAADGLTAWFDEDLDNAKYGRCRGTGVLVKIEGAWKIAQYNLSVPIPNELASGIVEQIRGARTP